MMRKILAGLLAVLLLLTCVSCGNKEEKDPLAGLPTQNGEEIRGETPDTQDPTIEVPGNKEEKPEEQDKKPVEDPKEEQKPEENPQEKPGEEQKEDEKPEETPEEKPEEQKPSEENKPQEEEKPESPYAGTAVSFKTQTAKVLDSGSLEDIADLKIMASTGDHLYLLNSVNALERFNAQITDWNEANASGGNTDWDEPSDEEGEEPEEEYEEEEIIQYSLQDELGETYNTAFFKKKVLLIFPISGTAGTLEALTLEGTALNIYMKKVNTGAGILGEIATNFVVMELDAATIKTVKTYKLNYVA